jgi:coenzyme F420-0:L-glutamate ligase / coenzyme F420-1:gamma-L-glutamate ligase
MRSLSAVAVPGLPEVETGTDLAAEIVRCCADAGITLAADDVVVVASKVVAKAEGKFVVAADRAEAVAAQTVRVIAERTMPDGRITRVVESRSGPVLAAAGVDASDVPSGTVLLLPENPDASARRLRARLRELLSADLSGAAPAVLISDTAGRPWRDGVADFALGAAGLVCLDDVRGKLDRFGRPLEITIRAVGDEIASLADLVRGKGSGLPVAVVSGLAAHVTADDGSGAAPCVRTGPTDWFAFGTVEAVRASLGVLPGDVPPPSIEPSSELDELRLARAVAVAEAGDASSGVKLVREGREVRLEGGDPVLAGVAAQRLIAALWSEGLGGQLVRDGERVSVRASVRAPAG